MTFIEWMTLYLACVDTAILILLLVQAWYGKDRE